MSALLTTRQCCDAAKDDLNKAVKEHGVFSPEAYEAAAHWNMWTNALLDEDPDEYDDYFKE